MLDALNNRLKVGKIGVSVEQRGDRLYLVATLPPKPGSGKIRPYQQRIALGIRANPAGFKRAELEAKRLGVQLAEGSFTWNKPAGDVTVREAIAEFEKRYFTERERNPKTETTFSSNYAQLFKKLPLEEKLTHELLIEVIKRTEPNTRNRQLICRAYVALGKAFGIDLDIDKLKGDYGLKRVNPKTLPSDQVIQETVELFSYEPYQWVYGMLATFGLRPHEVFLIDPDVLIKDGICHVLDGKTGSGKVWPLYPEWLDFFDLKNIRQPNITAKVHRDYGARIGKAFNRNKIPFSPYALRHCWARRAIELGLDSQLAAKQMRHSHSVHVTIYSAWLDDLVHERAFKRILNNPDRVKPI